MLARALLKTEKTAHSHQLARKPRLRPCELIIELALKYGSAISLCETTLELAGVYPERSRRQVNMRNGQKQRIREILLIALGIALLLFSLVVVDIFAMPYFQSLQTQTFVSLDWAGYAVSANNLSPQPTVDAVSGSWTVPKVAISDSDSFSAAWIGIGGALDTTLIQVGSEQDSLLGQAVYSIWYEALPGIAVTIQNITISPGDQLSASIILVNASTRSWQIGIADDTSGACFTQNCDEQNLTYNSSRLTADWIVERPTVNNKQAALADFGTVTFTNLSAQIGGKTGSPNTFSEDHIVMQNSQNNQIAAASNLKDQGTSFTVTYSQNKQLEMISKLVEQMHV
jgi:hypothetical protein